MQQHSPPHLAGISSDGTVQVHLVCIIAAAGAASAMTKVVVFCLQMAW